ncbi:hypothetical protein GDO81_000603 [Engystomops pustulosus]|uniref:Uncharacterized protein n=1 Tax=Engystomops pustulosus TaxID=76066 RepID=A0AAV7D5H4_ENGPU|nr:hypothetical protein GDO81_000603 [Engystomops pustulosus]
MLQIPLADIHTYIHTCIHTHIHSDLYIRFPMFHWRMLLSQTVPTVSNLCFVPFSCSPCFHDFLALVDCWCLFMKKAQVKFLQIP